MKNVKNVKLKEFSLLIDGRDNYVFDIRGMPEPEYIVRGDSKIKQIMAASILAKVTRDMIMIDYENTFPGYGFARHKGYGTAYSPASTQESWEYVRYIEQVTSQLKIGKNLLLCLLYFVFCIIIELWSYENPEQRVAHPRRCPKSLLFCEESLPFSCEFQRIFSGSSSSEESSWEL
jgi:hypothetical protein